MRALSTASLATAPVFVLCANAFAWGPVSQKAGLYTKAIILYHSAPIVPFAPFHGNVMG
jgi:hypothetical protein